jgi:hypothetical protein
MLAMQTLLIESLKDLRNPTHLYMSAEKGNTTHVGILRTSGVKDSRQTDGFFLVARASILSLWKSRSGKIVHVCWSVSIWLHLCA